MRIVSYKTSMAELATVPIETVTLPVKATDNLGLFLCSVLICLMFLHFGDGLEYSFTSCTSDSLFEGLTLVLL